MSIRHVHHGVYATQRNAPLTSKVINKWLSKGRSVGRFSVSTLSELKAFSKLAVFCCKLFPQKIMPHFVAICSITARLRHRFGLLKKKIQAYRPANSAENIFNLIKQKQCTNILFPDNFYGLFWSVMDQVRKGMMKGWWQDENGYPTIIKKLFRNCLKMKVVAGETFSDFSAQNRPTIWPNWRDKRTKIRIKVTFNSCIMETK